jgi:beta-glucosidase
MPLRSRLRAGPASYIDDQEHERFPASVEVDEHVLRELYLLPFEMLVKDGEIAALMSSYNRVRGVYATEYRYTLTDILRTEWGFEGYVQSDFWCCRSAGPSLNAGMDHEMPDAKWLNETNVKAALQDTSLEDRDRRPGSGPPLRPDVPVRADRAPVRFR